MKFLKGHAYGIYFYENIPYFLLYGIIEFHLKNPIQNKKLNINIYFVSFEFFS